MKPVTEQFRYRIDFRRPGEHEDLHRIVKAISGPEARIRFLNMADIVFTPVTIHGLTALDGPEAEPDVDPVAVMTGKAKAKPKAEKPARPPTLKQMLDAAERRLMSARQRHGELLSAGQYQRASVQADIIAQTKREIRDLKAKIDEKGPK